eukprot:2078169-Pyramimonas_sp.AAC.1
MEARVLAAQPTPPADVGRWLDGCRHAPAAPLGCSRVDIEDGPSALGAPSETADLMGSAAGGSSSGLVGADGDAAASLLS